MTAPSPLQWLRPHAAAAPRAVRPDDVGPVGWQVLLRDGVLQPVWGDVAAVTGRPVGPTLRAAAVRPLVPPRAVLGRAGAVWVHTGGPVPGRLDVLVGPRVRRPSPHPARIPHECTLPDDDVVRLGEVRVTTPLRTGLDLARWLEPAPAGALLARLVVHAGLDLDVLVTRAERCAGRRLAGRVRAALAAQPRCAGSSGPLPPGTPAAFDPVIR